MDASTLTNAALGAAGLYLLSRLLVQRKNTTPVPPGPKPKLLVGNLADLPPKDSQEWVHWAKHKELYGSLSCLQVLGQTIMIISDYKVAFDLLDKRSSIYSDRPVPPFVGEMCGWNRTLGMSQLRSAHWREGRKSLHQVLGTKAAVSRFHPLQEVEVRRFVLRVLNEPENLLRHIRKEAGGIILKISHGYAIEPHESDPLVDLADEAVAQFSMAALPGRWMVDVLPFLKYVPSWLPGAGFKRTAAHIKRTFIELNERPYAFTKQQTEEGVARPSYTADQLSKGILTADEEYVTKISSMALYAAGANTTVSSLHSFFHVMTLFPEVQAKAQEELDRVIGTNRLPSFADRPSLPYVDAILKEVLRWHPVVPMGLPHVTSAADVYNGMFIPKGTMLLPNIWLFMHDEANFKDPYVFRPERFLGEDPEMDPHTLAFGFGRRICPGRELADASIFLSIATSLAAFNIRKPADDKSDVKAHFRPGIISHLTEFRCDIKPRSARAEQLVRAVEEEHPWEESDAKSLVGVKWE